MYSFRGIGLRKGRGGIHSLIKRVTDYTDAQKGIVDFVRRLAVKYDRKYMLSKVAEGVAFPWEMWNEIAKAGYFGMIIPEKYGGYNFTYDDLRVFIEELARHGIATLHFISFFMDCILVNHGSEDLKNKFFPNMAKGEYWSFAITEPDAGTNTFRIKTSAVKEGDYYVINGQKLFITGANESEHMILITRTIPYEEVRDISKGRGLSIFVVNSHSPGITINEQDMATYFPEKQYTVFFDNVKVPKENLIGEEGEGIRYLFSGLNLERIIIAAFSRGMGEYVLEKGIDYARERNIFGDPIGLYQGIQHMLSRAFVQLELAGLANQRAARALDAREDEHLIGMYANMAKLTCTEAAFQACDAALQVHGGYGITREYDVINFLPTIRAMRVAPINNEMILNYLGEHFLELPKSYRSL